MLDIVNVSKQFRKKRTTLKAVNGVSLQVHDHETLALIGESGSGKSTLAEMIIGLQTPSEGDILWNGESISGDRPSRTRRSALSQIQIIFQNPDRSLNPYFKIRDIIAEPLLLNKVPRNEALQRTADLLEQVRLPASLMDRRPPECSGGQQQRVAIARALSMSPALLIADEITSALDPSTEEEILELLSSLKNERRMSVLYITHRLDTISGFADRVAVMKNGTLVESGSANQVLFEPKSAYARDLLEACYFSARG